MAEVRHSHAIFWILILLLGFVLLGSLMMNGALVLAFLFQDSNKSSGSYAVDEYPDLTEHWSYGEGKVKAVRIGILGMITRAAEGGLFEEPYDMVEDTLRQIRVAQNDPQVRAIILEVDSPGGDMTSVDEIYNALRDFRASRKDRRIITHFQGMAASGAYYVAMAGDWIVTEPTTLIGSIGVIMQTLNWNLLSQKLGVRDVTIISGQNKDLLNPFKPVAPGQVALLQKVVDELYLRFVEIVCAGRHLKPKQLKPLADGRVFSADFAMKKGLVDEIGYWDAVVARLEKMLKVSDVRVVRYSQSMDFFSLLSRVNLPIPAIQSLSLRPTGPRAMCLWSPETIPVLSAP